MLPVAYVSDNTAIFLAIATGLSTKSTSRVHDHSPLDRC